jgi:hypothetical protein
MSGPLDRDRLARVLGMLGSSHAGEVAAAGRHAERMRREAGMTWPEIATSTQLAPARRPRSIAEAIDLCIDHRDLLSDWERGFVASISRRRFGLSEKQLDVLDRLVRAILVQRGSR